MAKFLILASYSSEGWKSQVKNPTNRIESLRPSVERLGGKIETAFYAFGEFDIMVIIDFPDNGKAAAWAIAGAAGGALKSLKTVPLMSIEEGVEAMRKAGDIGYAPPGE